MKKVIGLVFCLMLCSLSHAQTFEQDFAKLMSRLEKGESPSFQDYTKTLTVHSKVLASFPDEAAQLYFYAGNSLYQSDKVDEAVQNYNTAYNYSLKAKDTTLRSIIILTFARVSFNMKAYDKAEEYYRYALPGMAAIYGANSIEYTRIYFEYIKLLLDMNRLTEAKPMLDALEFYFKTLKLSNDPTYLAVLGNQAYILQETGDYKAAIEKYDFILEGDKLLKQGDTLEQVVILTNIGDTYRDMGEYAEALRYLLNAKRSMQKYHLNEPSQSASIENNLGLVYKSLSDFKNSEECFDKAIEIYQKYKLDNTEAYCTALSNKADLLRLLGRRKEGLTLLSTAIKTREMYFGKNSEQFANALSNYGLIASELNENAIAQEYFEEALRIYKTTVSPKHQSYANCLNNLASCYLASGNYQKAEAFKTEAIQIITETLGKEHFKYISYTLGSADVLIELKKYDKAFAALNESKALAKKKFGVNHDLYIRSLLNLAYLNLVLKKYEESLNAYEEALSIKITNLNSFFYVMNREDQVNYLEELQEQMLNYSTSLFNYGARYPERNIDTHYETYFNFNLVLKSLLNKNAANWQKLLVESKDPVLKQQYQNWISLKSELNDLYKSDFSDNTEDSLLLKIKNLESKLKKQVNAPIEPLCTFGILKSKLKQGEVIIDINKYIDVINDTLGQAKYVALIIHPNSQKPECVYLSDKNFDEENDIEYYKEQIDKEKLDTISYNIFFNRLAVKLNGATKLFVSTKGVYNQISFQSLYNTKTKKYLIEELELNYMPNLSSLASPERPAGKGLTAELFGNPDFNYDFRKKQSLKVAPKQDQLAKRFGLTTIADLPGTEGELNEIDKILTAHKWQVKMFKRDKANEENLREVHSPKLVHIATHGYFLKQVTTNDKKFLGYNSKAFEQLADMRSGLILAGAAVNTNDSVNVSANKDGILTAREASVLDLSNTDLVVLSACQTGLGLETYNNGVIGLQQAFSNAGAKNLILSLWPVDDKATQLLMIKFYENWMKDASEIGLATAFKLAQLEVKKQYPHPYYWGAFVLIKN